MADKTATLGSALVDALSTTGGGRAPLDAGRVTDVFDGARDSLPAVAEAGVVASRAVLWMNDDGVSPLHAASKADVGAGAHALCSLLAKLASGVNVNIADNWDGNTPLHVACECLRESDATGIGALLAHGADPNLANEVRATLDRSAAQLVLPAMLLYEAFIIRIKTDADYSAVYSAMHCSVCPLLCMYSLCHTVTAPQNAPRRGQSCRQRRRGHGN